MLWAAIGLGVTWGSIGLLGSALFMFQFAAVVGATLHGGLGPGLLTAALSGAGFYLTFYAPGLESAQAWRLASFAVVSILFAALAARLRSANAAEREARLRAEAAQRLAELAEAEAKAIGALQERLVAMVSHDLRSPLSAITLSTHLLEKKALEPPQARMVARIATSAARMQALIGDLLDYARSRHQGTGIPVRRVPSRLGEICERALEELRATHPGRVMALAVHGDDRAELDPDRVEQVVANLVGNALKHGAHDRSIEVVVAGDAADSLRLEVRNEGPAIPPELVPALFDPFRAGDAPGSVGLGLFIVREIALAHGGAVTASSDDLETRFTVRFPRAERSPGTPAKVAA